MEQIAVQPKVDELILEDGEIICDKCEGTGVVSPEIFFTICPKCQGEKKLDWISAITGVKPKSITSGGCSSSGASMSSTSNPSGSSGLFVPFRNGFGLSGTSGYSFNPKKILKGVVKIE
jgi:hypothetical protein